jgi:hypothetical protein
LLPLGAAAMPGDRELAGRIELRNETLHTMLVTEAGRSLSGRLGGGQEEDA